MEKCFELGPPFHAVFVSIREPSTVWATIRFLLEKYEGLLDALCPEYSGEYEVEFVRNQIGELLSVLDVKCVNARVAAVLYGTACIQEELDRLDEEFTAIVIELCFTAACAIKTLPSRQFK